MANEPLNKSVSFTENMKQSLDHLITLCESMRDNKSLTDEQRHFFRECLDDNQ